jgi:hypothetical protein
MVNNFIKSTEPAKYLGVKIRKNLSWTNHINNITAKPNTSHLLRCRNFQTKMLKNLPMKFMLVRPHLEN